MVSSVLENLWNLFPEPWARRVSQLPMKILLRMILGKVVPSRDTALAHCPVMLGPKNVRIEVNMATP